MRQSPRVADFIDRTLDQSRRALASYVQPDRLAEASEAVLGGVIDEMGGQQFYIPSTNPIARAHRDSEIFDRYEAAGCAPRMIRLLADEYRLHPIHVYRLIERERQRRRQCRKVQLDGVTAQ